MSYIKVISNSWEFTVHYCQHYQLNTAILYRVCATLYLSVSLYLCGKDHIAKTGLEICKFLGISSKLPSIVTCFWIICMHFCPQKPNYISKWHSPIPHFFLPWPKNYRSFHIKTWGLNLSCIIQAAVFSSGLWCSK